jgi:hypothetical protein
MTTVVRVPTTTHHVAVFARPPADTMVTMRALARSMLWQTVFVRGNGQGVLTTLIGEVSGALQRPFRLSPGQVVTLRRLIAAARSVPPPHDSLGSDLYTLHISGQAAENLSGPMPEPLAALVKFLGNLMLAYCC